MEQSELLKNNDNPIITDFNQGINSNINITNSKLQENGNNDLYTLYDGLCDICKNNIEFYKNDETSKGQRLYGAFVGIIDHIESLKPLVSSIREIAHECDLDEETPGNGYRSFLYVTDCAIKHGIKLCRYVMENRNSLLFRKGIYVK